MNVYVFLLILGCLISAVILYILSRRMRDTTGLPDGRIIYTDTGAWQRNERSLYSTTYSITGKPDYLMKDGNTIVPVEIKSGTAPATPYDGHIMQLAAYCLLVEENLGRRPAGGIIQYADKQFTVSYTAALERRLLAVVADMRSSAGGKDGPHRTHTEMRRCVRCGVREACDERLGS